MEGKVGAMKKFKKFFIVFSSILLVLICYREYCVYQTKEIYNEFKRVFVIYDFDKYDENIESRVIRLKNDIEQYGKNAKSNITRWRPFVFGNEGSIGCFITVEFYDDNNNLIHSSYYFTYDNLIIIKKVNGVWVIDRIRTMN